jgi:hypothetical protein
MDEDTIYELGEQIRTQAWDLMHMAWQGANGDTELWQTLVKQYYAGLEKTVDQLYEEAGMEFCEECGELVQHCTCEDEGEETEEAGGEASEVTEA